MTPIQQLMLGVGASKKTYLDDVFSTYVYTGTGSAKTITNGIDLSGEGGLTFIKNRDSTNGWQWTDTVRGATKWITSHGDDAEYTYSNGLTAFNNNGFTLGNHASYNGSGDDYASWTFRKAPGFFDVVTYDGDSDTLDSGESQSVAHSLGCEPGLILVKKTSGAQPWAVYHRSLGNTKSLFLNSTETAETLQRYWNNTSPTSTHFTVGSSAHVNRTGESYVAYLFAGGESTAATARSVVFDAAGDNLNTTTSSSDFTMGTGDFTVECWVKADTYDDGIFQISNTSAGLDTSGYQSDISLWIHNDGSLGCALNGDNTYGSTKLTKGHWHHVAITRASGTAYIFLDGTLQFSGSEPTDYDGTYIAIGGYYNGSFLLDGKISNFRVVKGTAVYTSSFRPPTEPLTNITNTKLLCCNNSSTTGSTVTPVTLIADGDPTASTDSPFDDPAGFKFGDSKEGIIKCGSYIGDGASPGVKVDIGFEPQFIMLKRTDNTANWAMVDSMRGITHQGTDEFLFPNLNNADQASTYIELTSTGFQLYNGNFLNQSGASYIYLAIRRPDGYVGKTRTATELFAMDVGNSDADIPNFDSTFPVDFALIKATASSSDWRAGSRLIGTKYLKTNDNSTETNNNDHTWDSNVGIYKNFFSDAMQAWMWKRHAGFDVVTYKGDGVTTGRDVPHSMNAIPQMMWVKKRNSSTYTDWIVYHVGAGNTTYLRLSGTAAPATTINTWNNTTPTATHFTIGQSPEANNDGDDFIAMLFSSVDKISKVGYYDGSSSSQTITTGFQPRFVIIKDRSGSGNWFVLDTTRGWGSGNDQYLMLDSSGAQVAYDFGAPTSTGFTLTTGGGFNANGASYIYYAHA